MKINLILEEDENSGIFNIYLAKELLITCDTHEEVETFLRKFEEEHIGDNIILRFA